MNWNLVAWVAGTLMTFVGIKFVIVAIKTLFSKEMMTDAIGAIGDHISDANAALTNKLKTKMAQRKARKEAEKQQNKPMVYIR